jgi:hypothetical protein
VLAVRRVELHVIRLVHSTEAQGFHPLRFFFLYGFWRPKFGTVNPERETERNGSQVLVSILSYRFPIP